MPTLQVAPSILSADVADLRAAVGAVEAVADLLHVDVMDGRFVPNLTFGPAVVQAIRRVTSLPLDVHLMVEEPDRFLPAFREAGADSMTVHWEACRHLQRTVQEIRDLGALAGVAINPATPVECLQDLWPDLDLVLIMSVNPGFAGQAFWPRAVDKIRRMRELRGDRDRPLIEVDGGIAPATVAAVAAAGADIVVAGSAIFGRPQPAAAIAELRRIAVGGSHP